MTGPDPAERPRALRGLRPILLALVLAACGARGTMEPIPAGRAPGTVVPVYLATTRALDADGSFGTARAAEVSFGRYDVSIPKNRKAGEIRYPSSFAAPDPARHFLTAGAALYPERRSFDRDIARALAANGGQATVFVHGYNYNFTESLYRVAQFGHDLELPGVLVEYAWPSAASALGYVQDRDSVLFARNGMEELLDSLRDAGAKRIVIVAHSMGTFLAMETLRQIGIRGDQALLDRLGGVILISPDLDVDVFHSMARDLTPLPQPFLIFGSDRDRILRLSAFLTGQPERLGSLTDMGRIADLQVTFLDVGEFSRGDGHFPVAENPALIALLNRIGEIEGAFEKDRAARVGLVSGAVLSVQSATRIILNPVATVAEAGRKRPRRPGQPAP